MYPERYTVPLLLLKSAYSWLLCVPKPCIAGFKFDSDRKRQHVTAVTDVALPASPISVQCGYAAAWRASNGTGGTQ